jgi:hypothetical protein
VIAANSIFSEGAQAAAIYCPSSYGYIAHNQMEGTSSQAIGIYIAPRKPMRGSNNVLVENALKYPQDAKSEVIFGKDTCNNFFCGPACKISNLGSNDFIQTRK